jgi:hypothetical protein
MKHRCSGWQSSRLNSQAQPWFAAAGKKPIAWRAINRVARPTSEEKEGSQCVADATYCRTSDTVPVEKVLFTQVLELLIVSPKSSMLVCATRRFGNDVKRTSRMERSV